MKISKTHIMPPIVDNTKEQNSAFVPKTSISADYKVVGLNELASPPPLNTYSPLKILRPDTDGPKKNDEIKLPEEYQSKIQNSVTKMWEDSLVMKVTQNMWVNPFIVYNIAPANYANILNHDAIYDRSKSSIVGPVGAASLKIVE